MNSLPQDAATAETGHRVMSHLPAFGPQGLALNLEASATEAGPETYLALHTKKNDIVLYFGIDWKNSEVVLSKRIGGEWLDKITQNHPAAGGNKAHVTLTIRPEIITVEIDGKRLLDWPLDVFFTEVSSLHASGAWILESTDRSEDLVLPDSVLPDLPLENDLLETRRDDLIFDFGMHNGDDTDYYLKKGFRVVSVDANPTLCAIGAERFKLALEAERLTICNIGAAPARGELVFYINKGLSEWSSFDRDIASRGHPVTEVKVRTARPEDFFKAFGVPYYCKIDIEGYDRLVVEAIAKLPVKPRYVSFENGATRDFDTLVGAGYTAFQLVEQSVVPNVKLPVPSAEGEAISHEFPSGSSGPFGKDLDGGWLGTDEMRIRLAEHHRNLAARTERGYDWWDLHARHADA